MKTHRFNKKLNGLTLLEFYEWLEDLFPVVGRDATLSINLDPETLKLHLDFKTKGDEQVVHYSTKEPT